MEQDEWLDVVDESDVVVGRTLRSAMMDVMDGYFRAINLFIRNSKDELWIPRRTAHKKLFPLGLDFSCAGHVQSGDTYEETLKKEVAEELNLDIDRFDVRVLGKSAPNTAQHVRYFAMDYEIRSDEVPEYNPDDFVEYYWLKPEEVVRRIEAGEAAKSYLAPLVKRYYLNERT
jgi:isopentenyl-diphosphate delta-isomerase